LKKSGVPYVIEMSAYAKQPLARMMTRAQASVAIDPYKTYKQVTVRLFHRGVVLRGEKLGSAIRTSRQWQVHQGHVLLSRIDARNGAIGVVPPELDGAVVTNDFWAFAVNTELAASAFLDAYFGTAEFVDACKAASEGTTNRVRLQPERFLKIEIPLPPLAEQRRIVSRIEELSAKASAAKRLRELAVNQTGLLLPSKRAEIFKEVSTKGTVRFDSAVKLERGKFSHRPRNEPRFFGGNHPWIQIGEIENSAKFIRGWTETLNDAGLAISRKFPRGTVLVSIAATIGAVGILDFDCCVPDSIVAVTPKSETNSEFTYHYLGYVRSHLEDVAPKSAQKNVNLKILSGLPFPDVPVGEQRHIVVYLDNLQAKVDSLSKLQSETATELDALMPSILSRAFRGELR
jgi:type I restriction enzyme S subunit